MNIHAPNRSYFRQLTDAMKEIPTVLALAGADFGLGDRIRPFTASGAHLHNPTENGLAARLVTKSGTVCKQFFTPSSIAGIINSTHQAITKSCILATPLAPLMIGAAADRIHEHNSCARVAVQHLSGVRVRDLANIALSLGGQLSWTMCRSPINSKLARWGSIGANKSDYQHSGHMLTQVINHHLWQTVDAHEQRVGGEAAQFASRLATVAWAAFGVIPTLVTISACHSAEEAATGAIIGLLIAQTATTLSECVGQQIEQRLGSDRLDVVLPRANARVNAWVNQWLKI